MSFSQRRFNEATPLFSSKFCFNSLKYTLCASSFALRSIRLSLPVTLRYNSCMNIIQNYYVWININRYSIFLFFTNSFVCIFIFVYIYRLSSWYLVLLLYHFLISYYIFDFLLLFFMFFCYFYSDEDSDLCMFY